jgi:site-specific DNA recombinase
VTTAVCYLRRSQDPSGLRASVTRQSAFCLELASAHDLTIVATYEDNDLSAASERVRQGFETMLAHLYGVDVILAWETERLFRTPVDQHRLFVAAEKAGCRLLTGAGWVDPSQDDAHLHGGIKAVIGYDEVRKVRRRVRDAMADNATAGKPHAHVAYGWTRHWTVDSSGRRHFESETLHPEQAEVVRECSRRVLAGESLRGVAADLAVRGVPSPSGKQWTGAKVRDLVLRPRNCGIRTHLGEEMDKAGLWPAILSRGEYNRLSALLSDPGRRTSLGPARRHLLSGLAECGICGAAIRAAITKAGGPPKYRCSANTACTSRGQKEVDALVTAVIVGRLAMPDVEEALAPVDEDDPVAEELAELRGRREQAAHAFAAGSIDISALTMTTADLKRQIKTLEAQRRKVQGKSASLSLAGPGAAEAWELASLDQRRAVVSELLIVKLLRTRRGARSFDPRSVGLQWRE